MKELDKTIERRKMLQLALETMLEQHGPATEVLEGIFATENTSTTEGIQTITKTIIKAFVQFYLPAKKLVDEKFIEFAKNKMKETLIDPETREPFTKKQFELEIASSEKRIKVIKSLVRQCKKLFPEIK